MSDQSRTDPTKEKKSDETQGQDQGGVDPSKIDPKLKKPQPDPTTSGSGSGSGAAGRPSTPVQTGEGTAGSQDGSPYSQSSKSSNESDEFDAMFNRGFGKAGSSGSGSGSGSGGGAFTTSGKRDEGYNPAKMGEELKVGPPVIDQPCGMEDSNFDGGNGGRDGEC